MILVFAALNDSLWKFARDHSLTPVRFLLTDDESEVGSEVFLDGRPHLLVSSSLLNLDSESMAAQMLSLLVGYNGRTELDLTELIGELEIIDG